MKAKCYRCNKKADSYDLCRISIRELDDGDKSNVYLVCKDCMEKTVKNFEDFMETKIRE